MTRRAGTLFLAAVSAAAAGAEEISEIRWTDHGAEPISDWENAANWDADAYPDGPGVNARIQTAPNEARFVKIYGSLTLGNLHIDSERDPLPGGILRGSDDAVVRFQNGGTTSVVDYSRSHAEKWAVPVEFERDLRIYVHHWSRLHFEPSATFTPLCSDGEASLVVDMVSEPFWWALFGDIREHTLNGIAGFVADSLDGAPLKVVKQGRALFGLYCADNDYSGGTEVRDGALFAVNIDNLDSPFLNLGRGPVRVWEKASLALYSTKPGIWGAGAGYDLTFLPGSHLLVNDCQDILWKQVPEPERKFQAGSLSLPEGGSWRVNLTHGCKMRFANVSLGSNAVVNLECERQRRFDQPDAVFVETREASGKTAGITKVGNGCLGFDGKGTFSGGISVLTGQVSVASSEALGKGRAAFASNTVLYVDCADYRPAGEIVMEPGSAEVWRDPGARLAKTDDFRMPERADWGIACDLGGMEGKTVRMTGGAVMPYRCLESDTFRYVVPAGVTVVLPPGETRFGVPEWSEESRWVHYEGRRKDSRMYLLGAIREEGGAATFVKRGGDWMVLGGPLRISGALDVLDGTLELMPGAKVGPTRVHVRGPKGGGPKGRLVVRSLDAFRPGTVIEVEEHARLQLEFDGELRGVRKEGHGKVEGRGKLAP